jgi:hypothetical protein
MAIWQSQSVQFVWFIVSTESLRADRLFEQLTTEEPDSYDRNRMPNPANPLLGAANGSVEGFQVSVQLQPGRLDVFLSPPTDDEIVASGAFPLFDTKKAIDFALAAVERAPVELQSVRCALVVNLFERTETYEKANSLMEEKVELKPTFSDYSDFVVQINRRKETTFDNKPITINRLLKFSTGIFQGVAMHIDANGTQQSPFTQQIPATLVTIDVNNVPSGRTFAKAESSSIFKVLASEALQLAETAHISALGE